MKKLPKPAHKYGYTPKQISNILKKLNISDLDYSVAFGVNTMAIAENGDVITYKCDLERALYRLGHKFGRFHL